jgi:shikimate kinase
MHGTGTAHGALTVVNAIPAGQGAAIGLDLETHAEVDLDDTGEVTVTIEDAADEDPALAEACLHEIGERLDRPLGGHVHTTSEIPIARGLKSSSVAANAITLAVLDALDEPPPPERVLDVSVDAARRAGVTQTGALDDAAASLLGGLVVTDNRRDEIVGRKRLDTRHPVLCLVPERKRYTADTSELDDGADLARDHLDLVEDGRWQHALTLNGLAVAANLEAPTDPALRALNGGAIAAGLTGTGPATGAVCKPETRVNVRQAWQPYVEAGIVQTHTRNPEGSK